MSNQRIPQEEEDEKECFVYYIAISENKSQFINVLIIIFEFALVVRTLTKIEQNVFPDYVRAHFDWAKFRDFKRIYF